MAHKHGVYDTDTHYIIDGISRAVTNTSEVKNTIMQYDHNSERLTFELPKTVDGHDLTLCNAVRVHYINISAETRETHSGVYDVDDLQVSEQDENTVVFSWLISGEATQFVGPVNFNVRFLCIGDNGKIDYSWNTAVCSNISVGVGINTDEIFEQDYTDIVTQWEADVIAEVADGVQKTVDEWLETATNTVREEMASCVAEWGETLDVERVRVDELVAMRTTNGATETSITGERYVRATIKSNGGAAEILLTMSGTSVDVGGSFVIERFVPPELSPLYSVVFDSVRDNTGESIDGIEIVLFPGRETTEGYATLQITNVSAVPEYGNSYILRAAANATYDLSAMSIPELTDIRIGHDKTVYPTAGDAVRAAQSMADNAADLAGGFDKDIATLYDEIAELKKNGVGGSRISYVDLPASGWQGEQSPYSQVVAVEGATENSQVDLTPSVEQLSIFHNKDLAFVTENEDGIVTVYAIGQKPANDYTIQVTITEVVR